MKPLIKFSLKQGVLLNVIFVGLIIFSSWIALPNLPIEQFPNFDFGEITITTNYPGATADEVERLVTQEIEDSLRGMKNLDFVKSTSRPDMSIVNVKFKKQHMQQMKRTAVFSAMSQRPRVSSNSPIFSSR